MKSRVRVVTICWCYALIQGLDQVCSGELPWVRRDVGGVASLGVVCAC